MEDLRFKVRNYEGLKWFGFYHNVRRTQPAGHSLDATRRARRNRGPESEWSRAVTKEKRFEVARAWRYSAGSTIGA